MLRKPGEFKVLALLLSRGALCCGKVILLSAWKMMAGRILNVLNVLVPKSVIMENQKWWTSTVASWMFFSGHKSIDVANCQQSSNISELWPPSPF